MSETRTEPRIGVALGSGAARGLTHIPYIEAMDELGLKPSVIAGCSIGALIGSGWANGMTGAELRDHAFGSLGTLQLIADKLWTTSLAAIKLAGFKGLSMQADPMVITRAFLPETFPDDFGALGIPFHVVTTDIRTWEKVVFSEGPLPQAIAASIAIPSLFRPVVLGERLFIDGGVTNPLPLDLAAPDSDILVGIDVNGGPEERFLSAEPSPFDTGFIASQIMSQTLIRNTIEAYPPDVYVRPDVNGFGILEFWRVKEIVDHVATGKDEFKRQLTEKIEAWHKRPRPTLADKLVDKAIEILRPTGETPPRAR